MRPAISLVLVVLALASCASPGGEPYPLGPEMAQLARDLESESYPAMVLGMTNFNDLNGEILRIDVPDNARRFAARHSATGVDPTITAAHARRKEIEDRFLGLMREAYARIGRESLFRQQLADLFTEGAAVRAVSPTGPALPIEPILPSPEAEHQWPRWRGPWGQGYSNERDLPVEWSSEKNIEWRTAIPGQGNSSPIIWDDRIYLTSWFDDGKRRSLVSIRRTDGELLWVKDAPAVEPEGRVISKNGYASATPVTDGERVYTFFGNTGLVAFDLDGEVVWHRELGPFDAMHGTGASPVVCGDLVILFQEQSSKQSIGIALDRRTGNEVWSVTRPPALGWCTPVPLRVGDREELIWGSSHTLVSFDPRTGRELWTCSGPTREVIPTIVHGNGLVYSCSGRNGPTLAVRPGGDGDVTSSHLAWQVVRGGPHVPSPAIAGDLLYLVNDRGILTCLDALDGTTVYQTRLEGMFSASPSIAGGKIYLTNEDGDTFVVRLGSEYELVSVNPIGERVLASMAMLDGRIYLRGAKHLFAIGGGSRGTARVTRYRR